LCADANHWLAAKFELEGGMFRSQVHAFIRAIAGGSLPAVTRRES